jgi:stage V sporulation protein G
MQITEVRIKLTEDSDDRLQAFCSITFDDAFVVRDLKVIEGTNGPFVAMPSRKLTAHCPRCSCKNHLRANYCNHCGMKLDPVRMVRDADGRAKLYADIAHPIHSQCREAIQERVIAAYRREIDLSKEPGYVSRYEDDYDFDDDLAEIPAASGKMVRHDGGHLTSAGSETFQPAHPALADPATIAPAPATHHHATQGSPADPTPGHSHHAEASGERTGSERIDPASTAGRSEVECKLETAAVEPRPPHQTPREPLAAPRSQPVPAPKSIPTAARQPQSGFGAGILDEA